MTGLFAFILVTGKKPCGTSLPRFHIYIKARQSSTSVPGQAPVPYDWLGLEYGWSELIFRKACCVRPAENPLAALGFTGFRRTHVPYRFCLALWIA